MRSIVPVLLLLLLLAACAGAACTTSSGSKAVLEKTPATKADPTHPTPPVPATSPAFGGMAEISGGLKTAGHTCRVSALPLR